MARSGGFSGAVEDFTLEFMDASEQTVRATTSKTWEAIVDVWPVLEGRSRANWFATSKAPSVKVTNKTDKKGTTTANKAVEKVMGASDWSQFFLTNNLPYAEVIEYGGYPDPVKLGTRTNKSGTHKEPITPIYEKFSKSGYSKQAPNGAVRLNIKKSERLMKLEAAKRFKKI